MIKNHPALSFIQVQKVRKRLKLTVSVILQATLLQYNLFEIIWGTNILKDSNITKAQYKNVW